MLRRIIDIKVYTDTTHATRARSRDLEGEERGGYMSFTIRSKGNVGGGETRSRSHQQYEASQAWSVGRDKAFASLSSLIDAGAELNGVAFP